MQPPTATAATPLILFIPGLTIPALHRVFLS
jgi:hypothetical protein